jgi:hypothetical protein
MSLPYVTVITVCLMHMCTHTACITQCFIAGWPQRRNFNARGGKRLCHMHRNIPEFAWSNWKNYTSVTVVILRERDKSSTYCTAMCHHHYSSKHTHTFKQHSLCTDRFCCNIHSTLHNHVAPARPPHPYTHARAHTHTHIFKQPSLCTDRFCCNIHSTLQNQAARARTHAHARAHTHTHTHTHTHIQAALFVHWQVLLQHTQYVT